MQTTAEKQALPRRMSQMTQLPKKSTKFMILDAISNLNNRKGSSLVAIKHYMTQNFTVDLTKRAHFIKKALKSGVEKGEIVETGSGASRRFKMPSIKAVKEKLKQAKADKAIKKAIPKSEVKENPKKKQIVEEKQTEPKVMKKKAEPKKAAKENEASPPKKMKAIKKAAADKENKHSPPKATNKAIAAAPVLKSSGQTNQEEVPVKKLRKGSVQSE